MTAGLRLWKHRTCKILALPNNTCEESPRLLVAASLSVAMAKNDDQGSVRLVRRGSNNAARYDVQP